jgi:hypothetical protein
MVTTMNPSPTTAHEYIKDLPGVLESRPVKVTIKNKVYDNACYYRREFNAPEGCRNPGPYVQEFFYVVGVLPKCEDRNVCYTLEGDKREWYLAGGAYGIKKSDRRKPLPVSEYNPFGNFYQLSPWDDTFPESSKGEKIDHYEPKPYSRVVLTIEG